MIIFLNYIKIKFRKRISKIDEQMIDELKNNHEKINKSLDEVSALVKNTWMDFRRMLLKT